MQLSRCLPHDETELWVASVPTDDELISKALTNYENESWKGSSLDLIRPAAPKYEDGITPRRYELLGIEPAKHSNNGEDLC